MVITGPLIERHLRVGQAAGLADALFDVIKANRSASPPTQGDHDRRWHDDGRDRATAQPEPGFRSASAT